MTKKFETDFAKLTAVGIELEVALPGFWWSVGQCNVGAHASCGVDREGVAKHLLEGVKRGHPYDQGFHCDTDKGQPHEALRDVMEQALSFIRKDEEM